MQTSGAVLRDGDLLHPMPDGLAVQRLGNGDMRRSRNGGDAPCQCFSPGANQTMSPGRSSSTGPPSRWTQTRVPDGHDQGLAQWVRAPRGACPRLEGDSRATDAGFAAVLLERCIDPDRAGEPLVRVPCCDAWLLRSRLISILSLLCAIREDMVACAVTRRLGATTRTNS